MIIKKLQLFNFGPFKRYEISFDTIKLKEQSTILLTGKNNQGKTTIINALKLLHFASKVVDNRKMRFNYKDDTYYKLYENDIHDINIGRMIYNYLVDQALIIADFSNGSRLKVILDNKIKSIYASFDGHLVKGFDKQIGFIPPLGQIAEQEEILTEKHILDSINTTLAPRHLRNHFSQILSASEFILVRNIIKETWDGIELLDYEINPNEGMIYCFYKEKRFDREISWAGQGLQIWFQIITHLVRLKNSSILILDEPEIFLHTEKQIQLLHILHDYFKGDLIIATHSTELMNSTEISHIIHVKNDDRQPRIKLSSDVYNLEKIRAYIGSSFNFVASSFEKVDSVIFTEDEFDFSIIKRLQDEFYHEFKIHNIKIHGFMGYEKSIWYKAAYEELIGKKTNFVLVLDRDYYPIEQLTEIRKRLKENGIKTVYTPGKEIENLFINISLLSQFLEESELEDFIKYLDNLFVEKYDDYYGSYIKLHKQYYKVDEKNIIKKYSKTFREKYNSQKYRYNLVSGKDVLQEIRKYFMKRKNLTLTNKVLIDRLIAIKEPEVKVFAAQIFSY